MNAKKWSQQHGAIPKATTVNKHGGYIDFHSNRDTKHTLCIYIYVSPRFQNEAYSIDAMLNFTTGILNVSVGSKRMPERECVRIRIFKMANVNENK